MKRRRIEATYVPSSEQVADMLTKAVSKQLMAYLRPKFVQELSCLVSIMRSGSEKFQTKTNKLVIVQKADISLTFVACAYSFDLGYMSYENGELCKNPLPMALNSVDALAYS